MYFSKLTQLLTYFYSSFTVQYTDKKEKQIFLTYKEI